MTRSIKIHEEFFLLNCDEIEKKGESSAFSIKVCILDTTARAILWLFKLHIFEVSKFLNQNKNFRFSANEVDL